MGKSKGNRRELVDLVDYYGGADAETRERWRGETELEGCADPGFGWTDECRGREEEEKDERRKGLCLEWLSLIYGEQYARMAWRQRPSLLYW